MIKNFTEFLNEHVVTDYQAILKKYGKLRADKFSKLEPTHKCIKDIVLKDEEVWVYRGDIVNYDESLDELNVLRGEYPGMFFIWEIETEPGMNIEDYFKEITPKELQVMTSTRRFGI